MSKLFMKQMIHGFIYIYISIMQIICSYWNTVVWLWSWQKADKLSTVGLCYNAAKYHKLLYTAMQ